MEKQREEMEKKEQAMTWKERFYEQHLEASLEKRFMWPSEIPFLFGTYFNAHRSRADLYRVLKRFDLACLKEICRFGMTYHCYYYYYYFHYWPASFIITPEMLHARKSISPSFLPSLFSFYLLPFSSSFFFFFIFLFPLFLSFTN